MYFIEKLMIGLILSSIAYLIVIGTMAVDYQRYESMKKWIDSVADSYIKPIILTLGIYSVCAMATIIPVLILL